MFYVIRSGSDADRKLRAYLDAVQADRQEMSSIAASLGCSIERFYHSGGRLHAFCRCREYEPKDPPGGWLKSRLFPARNSANRELIKRIEALSPFPSTSGIEKALFPGSRDSMRVASVGGRICVGFGVGMERIGERMVIEFDGQDHVDALRDYWPKGLRQVKRSTVERWREAAA